MQPIHAASSSPALSRLKVNRWQLPAIVLIVFAILAATPRPAAADNPPFPDPGTCGFDLTLVVDLSASVEAGELSAMKNAMNSFVSTLAETPTNFSLVSFSTEASVARDWTSDAGLVTGAINSLQRNPSGYTNWQQALFVARNQFGGNDPSDRFNLIIFTSDGDPTAEFTGPQQNLSPNPTNPGDPNPFLPSAVVQAEAIWDAGIRILTVGIGDSTTGQGPNANNLKAISSEDAYYQGTFGELASLLQQIATDLCGGTVNVTKLLDADGDADTSDDRTPGAGWTFTATMAPGAPGSVSPQSQVTDASGMPLSFTVNFTTDETSVVLTEDLSEFPDHTFLGVICTKQDQQSVPIVVGDSSVTVMLGADDIVSCAFVNAPPPTTGTLIVQKQCILPEGETSEPGPFVILLDGTVELGSLDCGDSTDPVKLDAGTYTISEAVQPAPADMVFSMDCEADGSVEIVAGEGHTCLITNTYTPTPTTGNLIVNKECILPEGQTAAPGQFVIVLDSTTEVGRLDCFDTTGPIELEAGTYTVSEVTDPPFPVVAVFDMDCDEDGRVEVVIGETRTCLIINTCPDLTTPTVVPEGTVTPEATETATSSPTIIPSVTPSPTATDTDPSTPEPTNTATATATPTRTPTATATATATRPAPSGEVGGVQCSGGGRPISPPSAGSGGLSGAETAVWLGLLAFGGLSLAAFTWARLRNPDSRTD